MCMSMEPENARDVTTRHVYRSLLSSPAFVIFLVSRIISYLGDILFQVSAMWYVIVQTKMPVSVAFIPLIPLVTSVFFSQSMATVADRLPKKFVMVATDLVRAVVTFAVVFAMADERNAHIVIYIAVFLLTVCGFLFGPAEDAVLPKILSAPETQLIVANSLLRSVSQVLQLAGYGISGVVVAILQPKGAILADGISFIISAALIFVLPIPLMVYNGKKGVIGFFNDSFEGIKFILSSKTIRAIAFLSFFVNFADGPTSILTVIFSHSVLHAGLHGFGFLEASFALGGILGAILAPVISRKLKLWQLVLIALAGTGMCIMSLPIFRNLFEAMVALTLAASVTSLMSIPIINSLLLLAPDSLRGRIMAGFFLFSNMGSPPGP